MFRVTFAGAVRLVRVALGVVLLAGGAFAHASPIPVKSFQKQADGVAFAMNPGVMKIQVCTDRIIRVVYSPGEGIPDRKSMVVTREWKLTPFQVRSDAQWVIVSTEALQVAVNRQSGAVEFLDSTGRPLLREPAGGGKAMTATTIGGTPSYIVGQTFVSPADEALFGLGQFQDGLWNWRGIPLELRQLNTQISLPVLISSKGFGLLWDNASITDFNSPGTAVSLVPDGGPDGAGGKGAFHGTYVTGKAGEYVFCTRDGDRRDENSIRLDGAQIAGVRNLWTPYGVAGVVALPANKTCAVTVRGGPGVKLFARPLGDTTSFLSHFGEAIDYTFFYGPELDRVVAGYRFATGAAPMWPQWAYGFWQCRERYSSQQQILDAVAEFRKREIPIDLLVQDWQYWGKHGWGSYEWDSDNYPDPAGMIGKLHDQHVKFMISVWCNPHGRTLDDLRANNALAGDWIDVFNPKGREIRWRHINDGFFKIGADSWWGDATEPGDPGTDLLGRNTAAGPGDEVTNAYPLFASQSLYDGQRAADPAKRVCILTRSAFPGMQRYGAAAWSGDIHGDWETFRRQIPAGLNFCLAGIPYWTTDCGGFFHPENQYTSADYNALLARWFQWSTFCPILRIHGYQTETEMWKWLPETQKILLAYDQLRHRLLPYNYSVAWKVTDQGYTIMRALPMDFPADAKAWAIPDEYMFGPAFLVAPVTAPGTGTRKVYLPAGTDWIDFWTGATVAGGRETDAAAPLETIPLFVRAGSIIPVGPEEQYAGEKPAAPVELRVYRGANGNFTLYEDEGDGYNYERGACSTIPISWDEKARVLSIGKREGTFPGMPGKREFRVVFVSPGHGTGGASTDKVDVEASYNGRAVAVSPN